jgi:lysophospholipase L1-like esterase
VSIRPEQPEPFLRGCVFPAVTGAPYPRADPGHAEYLPADVWDAAQLPVGVRLELTGDARTIRVWYTTTTASLGYRGESAGCSFVAYRAGQKVAVAEAVMGDGMVELVMEGRPDIPVTVYLPEGMRPIVKGVAGVEEPMNPAPLQPRWLAYGDAVTQGWLASAPAMAWPAVAGRKLGLDVCNVGYAGTARGETTSALMLAETPAEVVSIAFGLNNWSRVPHTTGLIVEEVRCFLSIVRQGHPEIPIIVLSPTARPDAEETANRVGATLSELRRAMEETVRQVMADGDDQLHLVEGLAVVDPGDLEDGMYPGDEGHRRLAAAVAKILAPHMPDLQTAAEKRWAADGTPSVPVASSSGVPPAIPTGSSSESAPPGQKAPETPSLRFDPVEGPAVDRAVLNDALDGLTPLAISPDDLTSLEEAFQAPPAVVTNGATPNGPVPNGPVTNGSVTNGSVTNGSVTNVPTSVGARGNGTGPVPDENAADENVSDERHPDGRVGDEPVAFEQVTDASAPSPPAGAETVAQESVPSDLTRSDPAATALSSDLAPVGGISRSGDASSDGDAGSSAMAPPAVRRDNSPVDIEIADMVVAALTLATNGADDVIFDPDVDLMDELDDEPPATTYQLDWPEPGAAEDELQWTATTIGDDELEWQQAPTAQEVVWDVTTGADQTGWTEPEATGAESEWAESGWTETAPTDESGWADTDIWVETEPGSSETWSEGPAVSEGESWAEGEEWDEGEGWADGRPAAGQAWAADPTEQPFGEQVRAEPAAEEPVWNEIPAADPAEELQWSAAVEPSPS